MIVISDTTAISSLFIINKLELLKVLFHKVIIPNAVYEELLVLEQYDIDISVIKNAGWIEVKASKNFSLIEELSQELDIGESEAIALAAEIEADLLIIDEKRGRLKAKELGIPTVGLIGIISQLKMKGHIRLVKPILDELRNTGFWISDTFYHKILEAEGEL